MKRSFEEIFISTFHNKVSFDEFLTLDIESEFKKIPLQKRTVYAPSSKLKQIHRFLNHAVFEYAEFNKDVVFSYRKGESTRAAVEKHANNRVFYQADIKDFFGSLKKENILHTIEAQLENTPVLDIVDYRDRLLDFTVVDDHIPAGFATSPILSNLCLFEFDNALENICKKEELTYTRYADDIIISSQTDAFLPEIEEKIQKLLSNKVNPEIFLNLAKRKVQLQGQRIKILGFNILPNGIVTIPNKDKKNVETMLHFFINDEEKFKDYVSKNIKPNSDGESSLRDIGISSLSGKLISLNSMDKNYISKLKKKYGNTVIDMFIRKSVK